MNIIVFVLTSISDITIDVSFNFRCSPSKIIRSKGNTTGNISNQMYSSLLMRNEDPMVEAKVMAIVYIAYDHEKYPGNDKKRHHHFQFILVDYVHVEKYKSFIPLPVLQYKIERDKNIHPYLISANLMEYPLYVTRIVDNVPVFQRDEDIRLMLKPTTFFYCIHMDRSHNVLQWYNIKRFQQSSTIGWNPKTKGNDRCVLMKQ